MRGAIIICGLILTCAIVATAAGIHARPLASQSASKTPSTSAAEH